MRKSILKKAAVFLDFIFPCFLSIILISRLGLIWIFAILALECLQFLISGCLISNALKNYYHWKILLTSTGIAAGAWLYPVSSSPEEVGTAVCVLVIAIHFGVYMILTRVFKKTDE